jgi:hypothetical protein
MAGSYGANISSQNTFNTYKTWVAEIYGGSVVSTSAGVADNKITVFPNPAYDLIQVSFSTDRDEEITIEIRTILGVPVKVLYSDTPRRGENKLSFNQQALPAGSYFLTIRTNTKILKNETIIILD